MTTDAIASMERIRSTFEQLAAPSTATRSSSTAAAAPTASSAQLFASLIEALKATSTTGTTTTGTTGTDITTAAKSYEGVPYVFGGTSRDGIDCTGLVQQVLGDVGIKVGRSMDAQMQAGTEVGSLAEAKPGDLIVLDGGAHIVIYAGNGMVTHAPYEGRTVTTQKAWFDDSDIVTIRRVAPEAAPAAAPASSDLLQVLINAQAALLGRSL